MTLPKSVPPACRYFYNSFISIRTKRESSSAIRTAVVLVMAWAVALATGRTAGLSAVSRKEGWFIALSGLATGGSWLCYFRALQLGPASAVAPIDKLSILVTVAFSRLALGERLSRRAAVGLALLVAGTLGMLAA